jgi:hypothetical protein
LPADWQSRNLIDSPPNKLGYNKDIKMKEMTYDPWSKDCEDFYLPAYHLACVDPVTRRVEKPSDCKDDVKFYDRLMYEANLFMERDGEIGLCLFKQAYEVARDSKELGPTECFLAAEELNKRGFFELAHKLFAEIAAQALKAKDTETLRSLIYSLWQCGGFARNNALTLADVILSKHPDLVPELAKKKRSK